MLINSKNELISKEDYKEKDKLKDNNNEKEKNIYLIKNNNNLIKKISSMQNKKSIVQVYRRLTFSNMFKILQ